MQFRALLPAAFLLGASFHCGAPGDSSTTTSPAAGDSATSAGLEGKQAAGPNTSMQGEPQASEVPEGEEEAPSAETASTEIMPVVQEDPEPVEYQEGGTDVLVDRVMRLHGEEIQVVVPQPAEGKPVVANLRIGAKGKTLKIRFRKNIYADYLQVVGELLPKFAGKRVAMVQIFLESCEDSFTRETVTALVFVGDKKKQAKVLWQGEGSYQNYGGECEELNVISFELAGANKARVMRHREVIAPAGAGAANGDAADCVAKPKRVERVAQVKIP